MRTRVRLNLQLQIRGDFHESIPFQEYTDFQVCTAFQEGNDFQ